MLLTRVLQEFDGTMNIGSISGGRCRLPYAYWTANFIGILTAFALAGSSCNDLR
jgi:hypothetical protein